MAYKRKSKKVPCLDCLKLEVVCMDRCRACYTKYYRSTESGKIGLKKYNNGKGRETQMRYRDKHRKTPKIKEPKPPCECGKPSKCKGFCISCYQKNYQRKLFGYSGNTRKKIELDITKEFNLVLICVMEGMTIQNACKKHKIERTWFYKNITQNQKIELISLKATMRATKQTYPYR